MTKKEMDARISFLGSPAAGMLERGHALMKLCSDGIAASKNDNAVEAAKWRTLSESVMVAMVCVRDQVLDSLADAESSILRVQ